MNNKGQFLLYDIVLAIFIIFIIIICMTYVIEGEEDTSKSYTEAQDTLSLLASTKIHNDNLLEALSQNDTAAREVASEILSEKKYTLKDLTTNKTLLRVNSSDYHEVITARKIVGNQEYELSFYI